MAKLDDERNPRLIELSLEQLNHEKALLKIPMREKGSQLRTLQKEVGDLKETYEELDLECLRRDKTYKQLELDAAAESK
jgi:hypothetical protein